MDKIQVQYWPNSPQLEITPNGGCVDLYNHNEIVLKQGEWGFIHFGVSMKLPEGYDALILPRSSTFKRYGILMTNSIGYIDNSYCGPDDEWMACVYATRDITIPAGTRCFQFRVVPCQNIELKKVNRLSGINRSGYGSTGV